MRRHKAVARIFLFLSIVNFTLASIAQTPITREARVVAEVSEMGHAQSSSSSSSSSSEPPESSRRPSALLQSRIDFIPAASFSKDSKEPDEDRFFSEELKRKLKEYLILGSIAGVFTGVANGVQKEMMGTVSPGVYVILFLFLFYLPPSCQHLNGMA